MRTQDLVLQSDVVPGGTIKKWEWRCYTSESGTYNNFSIKLCHTTRTALARNFAANFDGNTPVEVYRKSVETLNPAARTWFGFNFQTDFEYDGRRNFLIDVSWAGDSGGTAYTYWSPATARCVYNYNGGDIYLANYIHYMRITVEPNAVTPTSFGRVKTIFR